MGIRLADQQVIGKVGRVTGTIAPERVGEVMISIRGGSEAFNAYAADTTDTICDRHPRGRDRVLPATDRRSQPHVGLRRKAEEWIP